MLKRTEEEPDTLEDESMVEAIVDVLLLWLLLGEKRDSRRQDELGCLECKWEKDRIFLGDPEIWLDVAVSS
jgi:hypothetical protein